MSSAERWIHPKIMLYAAQKFSYYGKLKIKETADFVTFTEEILYGKFIFLCSVYFESFLLLNCSQQVYLVHAKFDSGK